MSDLISRSALIEEFRKTYCGHVGMEISDSMMSFKSICRKINNAPTVEAKPVEWIPVTELDLDHNQEALIKLDDGFICSAKFLISDSGNNCGFYHKHIGFLQCPQVVAWMPYNAERGGKNE